MKMLEDWQYGLLILGILFTMSLIFLLVRTLLDNDKYNHEIPDSNKYLDEIEVLGEHNLRQPVQRFQPYPSQNEICAQFIPLQVHESARNKDKYYFFSRKSIMNA